MLATFVCYLALINKNLDRTKNFRQIAIFLKKGIFFNKLEKFCLGNVRKKSVRKSKDGKPVTWRLLLIIVISFFTLSNHIIVNILKIETDNVTTCIRFSVNSI